MLNLNNHYQYMYLQLQIAEMLRSAALPSTVVLYIQTNERTDENAAFGSSTLIRDRQVFIYKYICTVYIYM